MENKPETETMWCGNKADLVYYIQETQFKKCVIETDKDKGYYIVEIEK